MDNFNVKLTQIKTIVPEGVDKHKALATAYDNRIRFNMEIRALKICQNHLRNHAGQRLIFDAITIEIKNLSTQVHKCNEVVVALTGRFNK